MFAGTVEGNPLKEQCVCVNITFPNYGNYATSLSKHHIYYPSYDKVNFAIECVKYCVTVGACLCLMHFIARVCMYRSLRERQSYKRQVWRVLRKPTVSVLVKQLVIEKAV